MSTFHSALFMRNTVFVSTVVQNDPVPGPPPCRMLLFSNVRVDTYGKHDRRTLDYCSKESRHLSPQCSRVAGASPPSHSDTGLAHPRKAKTLSGEISCAQDPSAKGDLAAGVKVGWSRSPAGVRSCNCVLGVVVVADSGRRLFRKVNMGSAVVAVGVLSVSPQKSLWRVAWPIARSSRCVTQHCFQRSSGRLVEFVDERLDKRAWANSDVAVQRAYQRPGQHGSGCLVGLRVNSCHSPSF